MRVLFDHQCFVNQEYGGISRYFVEVWKQFQSLEIEIDTSIIFSNNEYLKEIEYLNSKLFFKGIEVKGKRQIMNFINTSISINKFISNDYDIFHATYYDPYFISLIGKKPFVVTFYDAIHVLFGEKYKILNDRKLIENQRQILKKSNLVLAISENTKQDLINYFKVPASKIQVTHLSSNNFDLISADKLQLGLPEKYVLYVGNRDYYKNFIFFAESIKDILINNDIYLVCAGGGKFNEFELSTFNKIGIANRVKFFKIDNLSLPKLYMNALVFAFPSLYEGFGIPLLEAMYCGCPVAASNTSSLPEIGANACEYFDPTDMNSICNSISKVIFNEEYRFELIQSGKYQKQKYSWKNTALKTYESYKTLF